MIFSPKKNAQGFGLVELMIALLLASFLILTAATLLMQSSRENHRAEEARILQANGRVAMRVLEQALSISGYWGGIVDKQLIVGSELTVSNDCGEADTDWALNPNRSDLIFYNNISSSINEDRCFVSNEVLENTDIISTRYVNTDTVNTPHENGTFLKTNSLTGTLFQGAVEPALPSGIASIRQVGVEMFYISKPSGTQAPSLCSKSLATTVKAMETTCLVSGVENLQIEFGIDSDQDLSIDYYSSNPSEAELDLALNAKLYLLIRNELPITGYTNTKTYTLGSVTVAAKNDAHLREVFSSTVLLRNHGLAKVRVVGI